MKASKKNIIVIGAGIGGLSVSALMQARGYNVTLLEKNSTPGGKMQQVQSDRFRFDTGPSLLTMPFLLEKLFSECGEKLQDFITLEEPDPVCRYFYADGTVMDSYSNADRAADEINRIAPEDVTAYREFLNYAEELFNKTADPFLYNPLYQLSDLKSLKWADLLSIDAFSTVSEEIDSRFKSPYLRQFFKRFTTYNGSSPYQAPATLNVIPHVELNMGGYYVRGGLYSIAKSLEKLCIKLGVSLKYNSEVTELVTNNRLVTSVRMQDGTQLLASHVISNSDATETITKLLQPGSVSITLRKKQKSIEPSCSGFVVLLGCNRQWDQLVHHNIFFSTDYKQEFRDIFEFKQFPDDPTIYIANTSYTDDNDAPDGGSNLFILINVPYLTDNQNWKEDSIIFQDKIINLLETKGVKGLRESIKFSNNITPDDFYRLYRSNRGSIYGTSSNNKLSAFIRPRNKLRELDNLYLVGGSTHPGGGIPLVIQSAFNAAELFNR